MEVCTNGSREKFRELFNIGGESETMLWMQYFRSRRYQAIALIDHGF
jgi:hypothetical protein